MTHPSTNRFPVEKFTLHAGRDCRHVKYDGRLIGVLETLPHRLHQKPRYRVRFLDAKRSTLFGVDGYDETRLVDEISTHFKANVERINETVTEYHQLGEDYRRVQHEPARAAIEYAVRKTERELKAPVELIRLVEPDFKLHLSRVTESY